MREKNNKTILFEKHDAIGVITLNRPESLNALSVEMFHELDRLLVDIAQERLLALVFCGAGEKAFVAGADLRQMQAMEPAQALVFSAKGTKVFSRLAELPFPVIAAVHGHALGGGLELALACDLIYASSLARFGLPGGRFGLIPAFGGLPRLRQRIGSGLAREMLLAAKTVDAKHAMQNGLCDRVLPASSAAKLTDMVCEIVTAEFSGGFSWHALTQAKRALCEAENLPLVDALNGGSVHFAGCFEDPEQKKRIADFLAKKPIGTK